MKSVVQAGPGFTDSAMGGVGDAVDDLEMGCLPQVHGPWKARLQDRDIDIRDGTHTTTTLRAKRGASEPVYIPPSIQSGGASSSQVPPAKSHKKTRRAGKKDELGNKRKTGKRRGYNKAQFEARMKQKQRSGVDPAG
ncbi:hypothetical protein R3P38DRAFT_3168054 [Favolaschia claudopus]|uniref:Uncharacterized protein n=1 Tax=Favolaschia claudopus TaxID=2862362 RepID=A0AAW0E872_9AGAR